MDADDAVLHGIARASGLPVDRPPPVPEHVWLGDLAGWSIGLTTDAESPIILHRCGYAHLVPSHDNFLANVAQWVSEHRDDHSCQEVMRALRPSP